MAADLSTRISEWRLKNEYGYQTGRLRKDNNGVELPGQYESMDPWQDTQSKRALTQDDVSQISSWGEFRQKAAGYKSDSEIQDLLLKEEGQALIDDYQKQQDSNNQQAAQEYAANYAAKSIEDRRAAMSMRRDAGPLGGTALTSSSGFDAPGPTRSIMPPYGQVKLKTLLGGV